MFIAIKFCHLFIKIAQALLFPVYRWWENFIDIGYELISDELKPGVDKNLTKVDTIRGMINLTRSKTIFTIYRNTCWGSSEKTEYVSLFNMSL